MTIQGILNQAFQLHQAGKIQDAIKLYLKILPEQQKNADLMYLLGTAYRQIGELIKGIEWLKKSASINPRNHAAQNNLGNALKDLNRLDEALASYDQAIALKPDYAEAFYNRAITLNDLNRLYEALASYDQAIAHKPDYAEAYNNRGNTLRHLKSLSKALCSYDKAIELSPAYVEAYNNRGNALKDLKKLDEALVSYDEAIALKPDYAEAFYNRGITLNDLNRLYEALESFDQAIALKPDYAEAYNNRGNVLKDLKRLGEALVSYHKAIALNSDYDYLLGTVIHMKMEMCDWSGFDEQLEELIRKIENKESATFPFSLMALVDAPKIHKITSEMFVRKNLPALDIDHQFSHSFDNKKIRVGYFSADFHDHATLHLMAELFEKHDKNNFEFIAFSFGSITNDIWQKRAKLSFSQFIDCRGNSDAEIAQLSRDIGIDIAVDLKGFTQDLRPGIFAQHAAPIQVNFLGYPGTMAAEFIDYIVADEIVIPNDFRDCYTEKVAYLPDCYQPNCRNRDISLKLITRSDLGLPENEFVFSSFNQNYKITPSVFESWMKILQAVAGSVLWVFATNCTAQENLKKFAAEAGVNPNRVMFAQKVSVENHLNRMHLADIMLDTFPYGAHTTCSDALRVGLPVITIAGQSFASRVAASLLTTIGLPELITESAQSYENLAIELATHPEKLAEIRRRLSKNVKTSPLYDPERFARNIESLYRLMHQRQKDGLPPDHIRIT